MEVEVEVEVEVINIPAVAPYMRKCKSVLERLGRQYCILYLVSVELSRLSKKERDFCYLTDSLILPVL